MLESYNSRFYNMRESYNSQSFSFKKHLLDYLFEVFSVIDKIIKN
jgi:hypothetical protein